MLRRAFGVAATVLLCACTSASAAVCSNPVFPNAQPWGAVVNFTAALRPTSAPQRFPDGAAVCRHYHGSQACCSAATLQEVQSANAFVAGMLDGAGNGLNSSFIVELYRNSLMSLAESMCYASPICPVSHVRSQVQRRIPDLQTAVSQLFDRARHCIRGMKVYMAGMMCLVCEPDAVRFLDVPNKRFVLDMGTCLTATRVCTPMLMGHVRLFRTMMDIMRDVGHSISMQETEAEVLRLGRRPSPCGGTMAQPGSCQPVVCESILQGMRAEGPKDTDFDPGHVSLTTLQRHAAAERVRARLDAQRQGVTTVRGMFDFADALLAVAPSTRTIADTAITSLRSATGAVQATMAHNQYADSGYRAYEVGCADQPDCPRDAAARPALHAVTLAAMLLGGSLLLATLRL